MIRNLNIRKYSTLFLTTVLLLTLTAPTLALEEAYAVDTPVANFNVSTSNIKQITQIIVSNGPRISTYYGLASEEENKKGKKATQKAVKYIESTMDEYGLETSLEEIRDKPFSVYNIIGIKRGTNLKDQIIIVCSHYDTARTSPGADDNALGVAATLEIARLLQYHELNRTVYFIAFPEHNFPMGAERWIEMHPDLKENITGIINLDQIGYGEGLRILYIPQSSWVANLVLHSASGLNISIDKQTHVVSSNSLPFMQNNIPAVTLMELNLTPYHHTPDDTIETINFSLAEEATKIATESIYRLATPEDTDPPVVNISSPRNMSVYGNNIISLMYNISEDDTNVQVLLDGENLGNIESGKWLILTRGQHNIEVWATDEYGNRGEAVTSFEVDIPILKSESKTAFKTLLDYLQFWG